jgi:hypothetical protein
MDFYFYPRCVLLLSSENTDKNMPEANKTATGHKKPNKPSKMKLFAAFKQECKTTAGGVCEAISSTATTT